MNPTSTFTAKEIAPIILRIGISLVFLWFGSQQLMDASDWVRFIPEFVAEMSPWSTTTLVHFNGAFEIVFGLALLIGYFTRITATLLALHILGIALSLGISPTGVRDFGITVATTAIAFQGMDRLSLDMRLLRSRLAKRQ